MKTVVTDLRNSLDHLSLAIVISFMFMGAGAFAILSMLYCCLTQQNQYQVILAFVLTLGAGISCAGAWLCFFSGARYVVGKCSCVETEEQVSEVTKKEAVMMTMGSIMKLIGLVAIVAGFLSTIPHTCSVLFGW